MAKKPAWISLSALSFAAFVFGGGPSALAQTAPSGGGIEQVVVTATRRAEDIERVPASVSAFTTERMDQLNIKNFADLVKFTPGVTFDTSTDNISIRGINSTAGDATTGIYIDDTPIQLRTLGFGSDNTLPAVFDLQRVEVLRGPQGTLFGAGSEGGTIRYITPQPSLSDYSVYAKSELSFTQYGAPSYEAGVAVGGPIVDEKLGFRVSGWWRHDGGYIDQINYLTGATIDSNTNRTNTLVLRGALTWQPFDQLTITPSVFFQERHVHNNDQYWVAISNPGSGNYKTGTPELMGDHDRFTLPALKIDYDLGGAELISNTSYFDRKQVVQDYSATLYNLSYFQQIVAVGEDPWGRTCTAGLCATYAALPSVPPLLTATGIDLPGFGPYKSKNFITNTQGDFTQEARLQSNDTSAPLVWTVGVFYSHENQLSVEETYDPQLPQLNQFLWGESIHRSWGENLLPNGDDYINHTLGHEWQLAGYANATYAITPQLKFQAGARLAKTHFDFTNFSDGPQNFGPLTGNTGSKDETPFTPMGGVTYQLSDNDMVYATVAKGYRIGGANPPLPLVACQADLKAMGVSTLPSSYNSDTVVSYEVGSKDRFLGGRLQASGSVFYLDWSNIQQANYLPSCGLQYTTNLGSARSEGFDLQGEWLVTDAFDVDFTLGYTDARYTSTSKTGPKATAPILANKGDRLPGSPWTLSVGAQYNTTVLGHDSYVRLDYEFQSNETGVTPARDPVTTSFDPGLVAQPRTNVVALRAGMTFNDNINVAVFADNLLNSHPQLNLTHQDQFTLLYEAETLRPRTIGITAAYRY